MWILIWMYLNVNQDGEIIRCIKGRKFCTWEKKTSDWFNNRNDHIVGYKRDFIINHCISGSWKNVTFKDYNFNAVGKKVTGGHLHPLLKVRAEFRTIFLEMGFEEMQTNNFVESSFWNFDALFTPQQHPARDAHDTFFLKG